MSKYEFSEDPVWDSSEMLNRYSEVRACVQASMDGNSTTDCDEIMHTACKNDDELYQSVYCACINAPADEFPQPTCSFSTCANELYAYKPKANIDYVAAQNGCPNVCKQEFGRDAGDIDIGHDAIQYMACGGDINVDPSADVDWDLLRKRAIIIGVLFMVLIVVVAVVAARAGGGKDYAPVRLRPPTPGPALET